MKERKVTKKEIMGVCGRYTKDTYAAKALGINNTKFVAFCHKFKVESPTERFNRQNEEDQERRLAKKRREKPQVRFPARHRRIYCSISES